MLTIYVHLNWLGELVVFYHLVRRWYIHKVIVQLVRQYFSIDCITDSISCSKQKNPDKNNIKRRQQLNTKTRHSYSQQHESKGNHNVVVVNNPPGSSTNCCYSCHFNVARLLHHYFCTVAPLSLCCRSATVTPSVSTMLLLCCYAVATLLLRCCYTVLSQPLRCRYTVATLSQHCPYTDSTLSLRCRYNVTTLSLQSRYANNTLSLCYRCTVATLSLHCR